MILFSEVKTEAGTQNMDFHLVHENVFHTEQAVIFGKGWTIVIKMDKLKEKRITLEILDKEAQEDRKRTNSS